MVTLEAVVPAAIVTAGGLIAWGELRARVNGLRKDVDGKASKEVVDLVDERLDRIERKVDKLLER